MSIKDLSGNIKNIAKTKAVIQGKFQDGDKNLRAMYIVRQVVTQKMFF